MCYRRCCVKQKTKTEYLDSQSFCQTAAVPWLSREPTLHGREVYLFSADIFRFDLPVNVLAIVLDCFLLSLCIFKSIKTPFLNHPPTQNKSIVPSPLHLLSVAEAVWRHSSRLKLMCLKRVFFFLAGLQIKTPSYAADVFIRHSVLFRESAMGLV